MHRAIPSGQITPCRPRLTAKAQRALVVCRGVFRCSAIWRGAIALLFITITLAASITVTSADAEQISMPRIGSAQRPINGFSLSRLTISGTVNDADNKEAALTVTVTATIYSPQAQEIPLRLGEAVLVADAEFSDSEVGQVLRVDESRGGLVWVIEDPNASTSNQREYRLTLQMTARLRRLEQWTELQLTLPAALVSSLAIEVPVPELKASVTGRAEPTIEHRDNGTTIRIDSPESNVDLRWWKPRTDAEDLRYSVSGEIDSFLRPGEGVIHHEVMLTIAGLSESDSDVTVRLPRGWSVTPEAFTATENGVVTEGLVSLRPDAQGVVRLAADQTVEDWQAVEMESPQVIGAVRHTGYWGVFVEGSWHAVAALDANSLEPLSLTSVSDEAMPPRYRQTPAELAFRYWQQPARNALRVFQPQTTVTVQPRHAVAVFPTYQQLTTTLPLQIAGGKLRQLEIDLAGWAPTEITTSAGGLPLETLLDENGVLQLPFDPPIAGRVEVTITATKETPASGRVEFALPVVSHALTRHPQLNVEPAQGWRLRWTRNQSAGLNLLRAAAGTLSSNPAVPGAIVPGAIDSGPGVSGPFLFEITAPRPRFSGFLSAQPLEPFPSNVDIAVAADSVTVRQRFRVPITEFAASEFEAAGPRFRIPREVWDNAEAHGLTLLVAGELATPLLIEDLADGLPFVTVALPHEILPPETQTGTTGEGGADTDPNSDTHREVEMTLTINQPQQSLAESGVAMLSVPLMTPAEAPRGGHVVTISPPPDRSVTISNPSGRWELRSLDSEEESSQVMARSVACLSQIDLQLAAISSLTRRDVIDTFVVQSWLSDSFREDRVLFRWRPSSPRASLALELPAAVLDKILLRMNGRAVAARMESDRRVVVRASDAMPTQGRDITVELVYRIPRQASNVAEESAPRIDADAFIDNSYWLMQLPSQQHLLWANGGMESDDEWVWTLGWERSPRTTLAELERRVGVVAAPEAPAALNQYLFRTHGAIPNLTITKAHRSWIVAGASAAALALGLVLICFPRLCRPGAVLSIGVIAVAIAIVFREVAPLVIQAALVGILLVVVAGGLRRLLAPRAWPKPEKRGGGEPGDQQPSTARRAPSAGKRESSPLPASQA